MTSFLNHIEFEKRFHVPTDPNAISDAGIEEVKRYIKQVNLRNPEWLDILPPGYDPYDYQKDRLPVLPDTWEWVMTSQGKTLIDGKKYAGRFTKRLGAYIFKTSGLSVPEDWLTRLGNIVSSHSEKNAGYFIDFTKNLHSWVAGQFGDGGSCFWAGREAARDIMEKHNVIAIRFYESDEKGSRGKARAWIVPDVPEEGLAIVWNGYGFQGDPTRVVARVLAEHTKLNHYRLISAKNSGSETGTVYINGGRAFIVGEAEKAKKYDKYDFEWKEHVFCNCSHCGDPIYQGDDYHEHNGNYYCDDCYDDQFTVCELCDNSVYLDDTYTIEQRSNGHWNEITVCESCFNNRATTCDHCNRDTHINDIHSVDGTSEYYCETCYEDNVADCEVCGTTFPTDQLCYNDDTDQTMCEVCLADYEETHPAEPEELEEA